MNYPRKISSSVMNNFTIKINGHSMEPFICDGDELIFSPSKNYSLGDIILFKGINGEYIAHRMIAINPPKTKGDIPLCHEILDIDTSFGKAVAIVRNNIEISLVGKSPWMATFAFLSRMRQREKLLSIIAKLLIHSLVIIFQIIYSRPKENHI